MPLATTLIDIVSASTGIARLENVAEAVLPVVTVILVLPVTERTVAGTSAEAERWSRFTAGVRPPPA